MASLLKAVSIGMKQSSIPMVRGSAYGGTYIRNFSDEVNQTKNIFIGNLPWEVESDEITEFFGKYGTVSSIKIMKDNQTGRPRGFGFVTLNGTASRIEKAITELDGKELKGRSVRVNEAKAQETSSRQPRSYGGDRPRYEGGRSGDRGGNGEDRGNRGDQGNRSDRGDRRQNNKDRDDDAF